MMNKLLTFFFALIDLYNFYCFLRRSCFQEKIGFLLVLLRTYLALLAGNRDEESGQVQSERISFFCPNAIDKAVQSFYF
jgi:hypothetical protein